MKKLLLVCLFLASPAYADESVLIDCEFFSNYLNSLASMRDQGKTEDEVLAAIDNSLDPKIQRHLHRIVSRFLFTYRNELSTKAVTIGYLRECKAHRGYIPENLEEN
jgi:hypothetical protein